MNTTARMESTGKRGRIHVSQETASLLQNAGKSQWLIPRRDAVEAKGKGKLVTYWVNLVESDNVSVSSAVQYRWSDPEQHDWIDEDDKEARLVNWNVEVMTGFLKEIQARRRKKPAALNESVLTKSNCPLDDVKEVITLPAFSGSGISRVDGNAVKSLDPKVIDQLRQFVTKIAKLYRSNPFHNFEHASHVCMSVMKLMSRIVAPEMQTSKQKTGESVESMLHDHTYGITSDPLTHFACAFSALIHDADHSGVANPQLIQEDPTLALKYNNRSVAEQNSLDLAWSLLFQDRFSDLRKAIFGTEAELIRFRELVVNGVMATDISDKDLKALRNGRWAKAFDESEPQHSKKLTRVAINRKATIVIEHLIQASDVAHTMQHWHVYRKWNQRLFEEMYVAYQEGRLQQDPQTFWYKGEIGFFDFYIIPLAKKLKECGVFGVSSEEYLNYALKNREEWEARGREVVAEMVAEIQSKEDTAETTLVQVEVSDGLLTV